jgi:OOP family OmpA-OmpF porin
VSSSIKSLLLIITGILMIEGSALAEIRAGAFTVSPMAGFHVIDGSSNIDDAAVYGLGLGYNLSPEWALEADFRYTPTELDYGKSNDVEIWTVSLGGSYNFMPASDLTPYLSMGGGIMNYDFESGPNETDVMGYYGGGIRYSFDEYAALRFDARHLLSYRNDDRIESPNSGSGRMENNLQAMIGLTFQFGGAPVLLKQEAAPLPVPQEAKKAPVDSDHDRVFDGQDKCPATPLGARVDEDGCHADTDGDGVVDYLDACVDTPKGTKVDQQGCLEKAMDVVSLTINVRFGFDKDKVTPFHYSELKKAADFIENYPSYLVVVIGHADDRGTEEYNQRLSLRRADNVRNALIGKYKVAADRISTVGFGETLPIAENTTAEGRALNRRVEININP